MLNILLKVDFIKRPYFRKYVLLPNKIGVDMPSPNDIEN